MNSVSNLRSWLRRNPQPSKLMLDGDPKRVLEVPQGRGRWVELLATLEAVDPFETIALLDANGAILRATKYVPAAGDEDDPETVEVTDESRFPIAAMAESMRLLIKDAMDALVRACDSAANRANTAEEAYARAVTARADAEANLIRASAQPTDETSQTTQLLNTFMGAHQAGQAAKNGQG